MSTAYAPVGYAPVVMMDNPAPALRFSGLGLSSLILSIVLGLSIFALVIYAGIMESNSPGGVQEDDPVLMIVGLGILLCMFGNLVGAVLGGVALCIKNRTKTLSVLGLVFNLLSLLAVLGLMIIGVMLG